MASSVTITGSRSIVMHQNGGSNMARQRHRLSNQTNAESIYQLMRGISASRIAEEPEEFPEPATQHISRTDRQRNTEVLQQYGGASLAWDSIDCSSAIGDGLGAQTRVARATRVIKRKTRRLFQMIKYYIEKFMDNYNATVTIQRPHQFALYY
ncbi:hypothetical protein EV178_003526 [Coemansia sp. RSA 1646]|nr:hypothetical protein EV178_003526 [Coemansia sp. RSA 1646]